MTPALVKVKVTQSSPTLFNSPWSSPGQNTGVGCLSLLQGIFPTQGSNTGPLHCRQILYQLSHQRSPRILERVAYPFSRGIFPTQEFNQGLLHLGRFFTTEPPGKSQRSYLKPLFKRARQKRWSIMMWERSHDLFLFHFSLWGYLLPLKIKCGVLKAPSS